MWQLHPFRALKRLLPRGLFGRSLIIIVTPVVILQGIVTYIFFERHYDVMLTRIGRRFAESIGSAGRAYRLGGDEFCALITAPIGDPLTVSAVRC